MSVATLLTESVTIQVLTSTQDTMGAEIKTFATRTGLSSLACMIRMKRVGETGEFGKRTVRNVPVLYCEYNSVTATIDTKDRVVWGSRTLEAKTPYNPGGKDVLLQIELEEID